MMLLPELLTLVSAYCHAFQKIIIPSVIFWKAVLLVYVITNLLAAYYEFSLPGGYTAQELAIFIPIMLVIFILFSLPTYLYFKEDLASTRSK